MEKIPYNYIGLMTFLNILKYENVRKIKKSDFDKYRELLLDRVKSSVSGLEFEEVEDSSFESFLSRFSDIICFDGNVLYLETIDGSTKIPWESGWKRDSSKKTIELDGVVYCYDNKNFFTKVFFNQQRNMTIRKYENEPIEVWNSNDGHKT